MNVDLEKTNDNWKRNALIIGAVVGALVGLGAAYLMIQNAEKQGSQISVTAGDGVKLGITVMGLLRQVAALGEGR
jgi:hypothetical protein